jgi:hypothetical protein
MKVSYLCLDSDFPIYNSSVAGMTGTDMCHHAHLLLIEMGSGELFAWVGFEL